ncbi:MAG TPA: ATP-binding cassette domain-containing protein [Egibacteraceae bacterium]|nr:ATP-binding cassette domain-containing protein [Egibacteraceae bacterium]
MSGSLDARLVIRRGGFTVEAALRAGPGETVALLGPNGAGKSTIVEALAGLRPLHAGQVRIGHDVLEDVSASVRVPPGARRVGVVFQDLRLFPALSARDNVAFGLRAQGAARHEARERAEAALAQLGAAALGGARPRTLSGGEAQRVALARALVVRPRLLLLDEPLAALDIKARAEARALLRRVLPEFPGPRLLVTHDPLEAIALADRLVIVEGGQIVQEGTPDEIRLRPRSAFAAALVGGNLLPGRLLRRQGEVIVDGRDGQLAVAEPQRSAASRRLADGAVVVAVVHPSAVALHADPPRSSARNVVHGRVLDVELDRDRARVRLESRPPLVAEITAAAALELRLVPGEEVWASIKATEVSVEPVGDGA